MALLMLLSCEESTWQEWIWGGLPAPPPTYNRHDNSKFTSGEKVKISGESVNRCQAAQHWRGWIREADSAVWTHTGQTDTDLTGRHDPKQLKTPHQPQTLIFVIFVFPNKQLKEFNIRKVLPELEEWQQSARCSETSSSGQTSVPRTKKTTQTGAADYFNHCQCAQFQEI